MTESDAPLTEPGALLRELRDAKGLSLTKLALAANYNKGYLSKIENGVRLLPAHVARELDLILETDGQLFRAVNPPKPAQEPAPDTDDEPWSLVFDPSGQVQLGSSAFAGVRIAPNSWVVDELLLSRFENRFEQFRAEGHVASPAFVIPQLLTTISQIKGILRETESPELVRLAYRFAEYAGWMFQEAGRIDLAHAWTDAAVRLAARVGDAALASYALVRSAEVALYDEDGYTMVQLARQAFESPGAPAAVRCLAAQREAQGHALLGDRTACLSSLDLAMTWHERVDDEAGPRYGTTSLKDPVAVSRGWAMLHLAPAESVELLGTALDSIPETSVRSRVRFGVRLARVKADLDNVDGACRQLSDLIDGLRRTDSATVRVDLKHLLSAFAKHSHDSAVRDLRPELNKLLRLRR